jgi:hypothetical protein
VSAGVRSVPARPTASAHGIGLYVLTLTGDRICAIFADHSAQGRGGVALTLLGSTTQQVVCAASYPVLKIRAPLEEARNI